MVRHAPSPLVRATLPDGSNDACARQFPGVMQQQISGVEYRPELLMRVGWNTSPLQQFQRLVFAFVTIPQAD